MKFLGCLFIVLISGISGAFAQPQPAPILQKTFAELLLPAEPLVEVPKKDITIKKGLRYGNHSRQALDVYIPEDAKNAPIILMVHGGAWKIGDKSRPNVVQNKVDKWGQEGFIFVSTNYRLLPVPPYNQAQDIRKALAFVQKMASSWGGNSRKVILMGHSAGAHLVALTTADPTYAYRVGANPWLGSVIIDTEALDIAKLMQSEHLRLFDQAFTNKPFIWKKSTPYGKLTNQAPPMMVICSTQRDGVCDQAKRFAKKAKSLGVKTKVSEQDFTHKQLNAGLGLDGDYTDEIDSFIQSLIK